MATFKEEADRVLASLERSGESREGCCDPCHYRAVDEEALTALESMRAKYDAAILALQSLTNPEGHIWHGAHTDECTGECQAVRAVLAEVSP